MNIEFTASWYVVWYWIDDTHYTSMKFMDYEDAVAFAKSIEQPGELPKT